MAHVASYAPGIYDSQHLYALFASHRFMCHAIYLARDNGIIIPIAMIQRFLRSFMACNIPSDVTYLKKNIIFEVKKTLSTRSLSAKDDISIQIYFLLLQVGSKLFLYQLILQLFQY